jgi:hypothetical protein
LLPLRPADPQIDEAILGSTSLSQQRQIRKVSSAAGRQTSPKRCFLVAAPGPVRAVAATFAELRVADGFT